MHYEKKAIATDRLLPKWNPLSPRFHLLPARRQSHAKTSITRAILFHAQADLILSHAGMSGAPSVLSRSTVTSLTKPLQTLWELSRLGKSRLSHIVTVITVVLHAVSHFYPHQPLPSVSSGLRRMREGSGMGLCGQMRQNLTQGISIRVTRKANEDYLPACIEPTFGSGCQSITVWACIMHNPCTTRRGHSYGLILWLLRQH